MGASTNFILLETSVRLVFFTAIFFVVALSEKIAPGRMLLKSKTKRWISNLGMQIIDVVVLRLIFPVLPVGVALICTERGWEVLNYYQVSPTFAVIAGILALDIAIYFQYIIFHATPLFWRLHMVHHTDQDIDVTTGLRFHPAEIILLFLIKMSVVAAAGVPAFAMLFFEVLLNSASMFNHGNWRIALPLDRLIRLLLVTSDVHRVHHSVFVQETNSNYGFSFS